MLNAGEDVLDLDVVLAAEEVGDELVAVAGGAAVVGAEDGVAGGGEVEPPVVRVEAEVVVAGGGRPAVDRDDQRQRLVALLPAVRQFQRPANLRAVWSLP